MRRAISPRHRMDADTRLKLHSDNKHPKQTFKDCFPSFTGA